MRVCLLLPLALLLVSSALAVVCHAAAPVQLPAIPYQGLATRAVLETCSGCQLNRLPVVREFVYNRESGAVSFERVTLKFIGGKSPEMIFYQRQADTDEEREVERVDIRPFDVHQLDQLLIQRGFARPLKGEPVPLMAGTSADPVDAVYRSVDPVYDTRDGRPPVKTDTTDAAGESDSPSHSEL